MESKNGTPIPTRGPYIPCNQAYLWDVYGNGGPTFGSPPYGALVTSKNALAFDQQKKSDTLRDSDVPKP